MELSYHWPNFAEMTTPSATSPIKELNGDGHKPSQQHSKNSRTPYQVTLIEIIWNWSEHEASGRCRTEWPRGWFSCRRNPKDGKPSSELAITLQKSKNGIPRSTARPLPSVGLANAATSTWSEVHSSLKLTTSPWFRSSIPSTEDPPWDLNAGCSTCNNFTTY